MTANMLEAKNQPSRPLKDALGGQDAVIAGNNVYARRSW